MSESTTYTLEQVTDLLTTVALRAHVATTTGKWTSNAPARIAVHALLQDQERAQHPEVPVSKKTMYKDSNGDLWAGDPVNGPYRIAHPQEAAKSEEPYTERWYRDSRDDKEILLCVINGYGMYFKWNTPEVDELRRLRDNPRIGWKIVNLDKANLSPILSPSWAKQK